MSRVSFSPLALSEARSRPKRLLPLLRRHLEEADALPHVEALVHPLAPLRIVHGEQRSWLAASWVSPARNVSAALRTGVGRDSGRADAEQPGFNLAVRGDALERLGEAGRLGGKRETKQLLGRALRRRRLRRQAGLKVDRHQVHDDQEGEELGDA